METNVFLTCLLSGNFTGNPIPIMGMAMFTAFVFILLHRTTRGLSPNDGKLALLAITQNHQLRPVVYELYTSLDEENAETVLPSPSVKTEEFFEVIAQCRNRFCLHKLYKLVSDRKQALILKTEDTHSPVIDADIAAYGEIEQRIAERKVMFEKGEPEVFDASEFCDYMLCCFNKQNWHELLTNTLKAEATRLGCLKELVLRSLELRYAK